MTSTAKNLNDLAKENAQSPMSGFLSKQFEMVFLTSSNKCKRNACCSLGGLKITYNQRPSLKTNVSKTIEKNV